MSEELAKKFHEIYERLAPDFGYSTRKASAVPWEDVPEANKKLMIAVCSEIEIAATERAEAAELKLEELGIQYNAMNEAHLAKLEEANNQIADLKEQLRWRKYPEEKPEKNCQFVAVKIQRYDNAYEDIMSWNGDGEDDENWSEMGVIEWRPISTLSPDTAVEAEGGGKP